MRFTKDYEMKINKLKLKLDTVKLLQSAASSQNAAGSCCSTCTQAQATCS